MIKLKRYPGDTNTLEAHDTRNERASCQLDEITLEHRRWYDTLTQAKADKPYDIATGASTAALADRSPVLTRERR